MRYQRDKMSASLDISEMPGYRVAMAGGWAAGGDKASAVDVEGYVKNRLKVLRAERDWSQAELGGRLGVSRQAVNAIETGKYDPSLQAQPPVRSPDRGNIR
jgi:ribosome-binding protein aMBF1 (putative translation factor)